MTWGISALEGVRDRSCVRRTVVLDCAPHARGGRSGPPRWSALLFGDRARRRFTGRWRVATLLLQGLRLRLAVAPEPDLCPDQPWLRHAAPPAAEPVARALAGRRPERAREPRRSLSRDPRGRVGEVPPRGDLPAQLWPEHRTLGPELHAPPPRRRADVCLGAGSGSSITRRRPSSRACSPVSRR